MTTRAVALRCRYGRGCVPVGCNRGGRARVSDMDTAPLRVGAFRSGFNGKGDAMRKLVTLGLAAGVLLTGWAVAADPPKPAEVKPETSPSPAKVEKVEEKPAAESQRTPLQMRFDVLELKLSQAEADQINKSVGVVDVAALAAEVIKRGDARVRYSLGGPVVVNEKASFIAGQRVPFVRSNTVTKNGESTSAIEYEKVGCVVNVTLRAPAESEDATLLASLKVEISDLLSESTVEISSGLRGPIFFERKQEFTARVALGRDEHMWDLANMVQLCDHPGNVLVHVYRLRFDPEPAKPDAKR
jgi:hypothetical protein